MAEIAHTCPHCGHGIGRLMRVKGEGVSNCANCHKSDWARRFPFPESEADRVQREAREARRQELEAIRLTSSPSDEETDDDELVDHNGFTPTERRQREQEELVQRVRDEESMKWAKGIVIGFVALLLLILWSRAGGDERGNPNEPTCQYAGRSMDCW
ncbi:hypothetical protein OIE73_21075 [Streptomyces hirsutus]|uniref:Uncharacterized protein n=1 Tax=Streptomyces hirsutus TaxID=35620 RepID=A0ABZ1GRN7_9ACTN|nr:hypothetical protein [Streptomyces hirsutus]WSD07982.1 hypothetical protein OIE73_21075 [Streptomyces hirsutus]